MPSVKREGLSSVNVTFLGTASAQPSSTRNHSALALRLNSDIWLFDCGEATQHQLQKSSLKMGKIEKIFITHTHGDHTFGLIPLLASCMNGAGGVADGTDDPRMRIDHDIYTPLEIYGPLGTRAYVRTGLGYTHTLLGRPYVVHELRFSTDTADRDFTTLAPSAAESLDGRNIAMVNGVWLDVYKDGVISVSAAPILHSVPCVGYVVQEAPVPGKLDPNNYAPDLKRTNTPLSVMRQLKEGKAVTLNDGTVLQGPPRRPGRKIVILGDTYDPSAIVPLAEDADMLIHEATNAHLPEHDPATKETDTHENVEERAISRGHSTPQMAGKFAKRIRARNLVLNHFSARYKGDESEESLKVMNAIGDLAAREFGQAVNCARDFTSFDIGFKEY